MAKREPSSQPVVGQSMPSGPQAPDPLGDRPGQDAGHKIPQAAAVQGMGTSVVEKERKEIHVR